MGRSKNPDCTRRGQKVILIDVRAVVNRRWLPGSLRLLQTLSLSLSILLWHSPVTGQFRAHTRGVVAIYGVEPSDTLADQLETQFQLFGWEALLVSGRAPANEPLIAELYFAYNYNSAQPSMLTLKGPSAAPGSPARSQAASVVWATLASDRLEPGLHPRVIALRAAELVRAALGIAEPEEIPEPISQPPVEATPVPVSLGVSAAMLSGETLGRSFAVVGRGQVFVLDGWNIEAFGALPLTVNRVKGDEGSADVRVFLVGAGLGHRLEMIRAALLLDLSIGGGVAILPMEGKPQGDFEARNETVRTALGYGQGRLSYPLTDAVRTSFGFLVGFTMPAVQVRFNSHQVGLWGRPMLALSLGFEVP